MEGTKGGHHQDGRGPTAGGEQGCSVAREISSIARLWALGSWSGWAAGGALVGLTSLVSNPSITLSNLFA